MIDTHVHLNRTEFKGEQAAVLDRARAAGITGFLNVGYDLVTSEESVALANAHSHIWATVGIHPHDAELLADPQGKVTSAGESILARLEELASQPKVVAIGEIGLDYFRDLSPRPAQKTALAVQLELANKLDLPVVFHIRDAWTETLAFLDDAGLPRRRGVLHAFSGTSDDVEWARERGFLLGIGGPVTYKNSKLPDQVRVAGLDMLLLETDAPWLPPVPYRGQRNESGYLVHTRDKVAELLGKSPEEIDTVTTTNFSDLFAVEVFGR